MRSPPLTFLAIASLEMEFENLISVFYSFIFISTVDLKIILGIFRFWIGVWRSKKMSAGKRLSQCSVFNDTQKFFYKVLELPSHYPFGWTLLSTYTHLILYPHCIIYSFITHIHRTFSHSMKNTVLYYLALLQIGLMKDLSKLITLTIWNKTCLLI